MTDFIKGRGRTMEQKNSEGRKRKDQIYVDVVAKALSLLEAFGDSPEPLTLSQLAGMAGLEKSAAQRLAHTLRQLSYLEQTDGGLIPGRKLLERSFDYLRANPIVSRAVPIMADLRRTVQERVDLSLFDGLSMLYVVRMQSKRESFHAHLVGRRVPTFCTSGGRAVMSLLTDAQVLDLLSRSARGKITPRTITDIDEIQASVERARYCGYAFASEQVQIGELAIAAPLIAPSGEPVGAIHVVGSLSDWEPDEFEQKVAPLAVAAATAINAG